MSRTLKTKPHIIQLDKRTAFFAALALNIFFMLVQLIILIYSFYIGENVEEIFRERISASGSNKKDINLFFEPLLVFLINTLLLYVIFRIEFWILARFSQNRRITWLSFLVLFLFVGILSYTISQLLGIWFRGKLTIYQYSIIQFAKDLLLFITSIFVTNAIYLLNKNQEKMEENKDLSIENLKNRYNALKNQTDPHFFFNSLNSLNGLIGYDDERAHEYLVQLSAVFRYTLQERSITTLSEEMEFTESYIHLVKIRFGEAFTVSINVPDSHKGRYILPFAIQTLVENGVKHNIVSLRKPLCLEIKMNEDEDSIIVENNLQPRLDVDSRNGVGLSNLNERYWLMFKKNITIQASDKVFRVVIPLVKDLKKYNVIAESTPL